MGAADHFERELAEHVRVAEQSGPHLAEAFRAVLGIWVDAVRAGRKLLLFGNGGSAAIAQHLAAELVVRYTRDREPIAAVALATDPAILTATGNDLGFESVFSRQIEALGRPGDVAVAGTTSGRSPNVIRALRAARERGLATVVLTGGDGGEVARLADAAVVVPSRSVARIQELHLVVGHALCGALERELDLVRDG